MSHDNCISCFCEMFHDNESIFIGIKAFYCKVLEYLQKLFNKKILYRSACLFIEQQLILKIQTEKVRCT